MRRPSLPRPSLPRPGRRGFAAALGGLLVVGASVALGLDALTPVVLPPVGRGVAVVVALVVGLVATPWLLRSGRRSADEEGEAAEPAPPDRPERSTVEAPVAGRALVGLTARAGRAAREGDSVDDGIEVVRPALREALVGALVGGGASLASARAAIESGRWTDDRVVASVLSADVEPPAQPLSRRFWAWLYPERVVRRRLAGAVQAVAEAAEDALPAVPGQTAPRTIQVPWQSVDELRDGTDAEPRPALDPDAVERGPAPPAPAAGEEAGEP